MTIGDIGAIKRDYLTNKISDEWMLILCILYSRNNG